MNSRLFLPIVAVFFTAAVSFGVNAFAATFTEPAGSPPNNNAYAPLDTSPNTNIKPGILAVSGFTSYSSTVLAADSGSVGIGTYSPSQKLDVAGFVRGASGLCIGNDCRTSWPEAAASVTPSATIYRCSVRTVSAYPETGTACRSTCNGISADSSCTYTNWDNQPSPACGDGPYAESCAAIGRLVQ